MTNKLQVKTHLQKALSYTMKRLNLSGVYNDCPEYQTICAWCKRISIEGEWYLPKGNQPPCDTITHGICSVCLESTLASVSPQTPKTNSWVYPQTACPPRNGLDGVI